VARNFPPILGALLAVAVLAPTRRSEACGLTPPIGPSGLASVCHGDANAPRVRLGIAIGGTSSKIDFKAETAPLVQSALTGTFDLLLFQRLSLGASLGGSLIGHVDYGGQRFELRPGPIVGLGASYRLFGGSAPFLHLSAGYSIARSTSHAPDASRATFTSNDYRFGVAVGKTLGNLAAPFVVGRYFGAGTNWSVGGGHGADHYRYHLGVGSAFGLSEQLDALVELAFLGERRATLGVGYLF
jgi:hypothetical protein